MTPVKRFLFILALTCMWSPSFLFIKLALEDFAPPTIVVLRVGMAALIFWSILKWKGISLPKDKKFWLHAFAMSIFASSMPFILFCYAERSIESALAAILNGSSPMFTALLAHLFLPTDKLSTNKILGILLSFSGVLLLFSPKISQGMDGDFTAMFAVLTASFCYAISHVYAKKYTAGQARFVVPTAQLFLSAVTMLPLAIYSWDFSVPLEMPSATGMVGIAGLTLLGTCMAFMIYYHLLEHSGPTAISMVACFFPVIGMFLGYLFLGESLTLAGLFSAGLILMGMLTVNGIIDIEKIRPKVFQREG